jgi:hypothetical protein
VGVLDAAPQAERTISIASSAATNEKIFLVFILFPPNDVDFFALLTYN